MDIDEPILLDKDHLFCETDKALAQTFLREAFNAVKLAGVEDSRELESAVIKSMLVFHRHREICGDCDEG